MVPGAQAGREPEAAVNHPAASRRGELESRCGVFDFSGRSMTSGYRITTSVISKYFIPSVSHKYSPLPINVLQEFSPGSHEE